MVREPFNPFRVKAPGGKAPGSEPPGMGEGPLTVSQVTALVNGALKRAFPASIHVVGEISNFKRHSSGHLYFTLKDSSSELSCVMWRSGAAKLKFAPTDGLEVIATGKVEVFERVGRYQLYVRKIEPRGTGALELAFRQLRERLEKEGLFDPSRKKKLPDYPSRIVVITSPTGAAVSDILQTIERRYPCIEVLVFPVRVQGPGSAAEISGAVRQVNSHAAALGGVDLMIVGRGGGSLEDLWAFNEETVARAIYESRIPVISAVGHEVDVTIADLVADVRAATPTAAAELAVPVLEDVLADLTAYQTRLTSDMRRELELGAARLRALLGASWYRDPLMQIHRREECVDELEGRMRQALSQRLLVLGRGLDRREAVVRRIAPHAYMLEAAVRLRDAEHGLMLSMDHRLSWSDRRVMAMAQRLERQSPDRALPPAAERLSSLDSRLILSIGSRLTRMSREVQLRAEVLAALSYKSVLTRGYSITREKRHRRLIRSPAQLSDGQRVVTETAGGEFESEVVNLKQLELFD